MRLPPKKNKQKQVVIDYTSLESAKSSAPASYDYGSWLEEGIKQEEQGERYQSGNKATRHYSNAVICFSLAASLASNDFDSRYNAARVLYKLATDHLGPREAYDALSKAILGYRDAVAVLGSDGTMARIDGLFNLAQADVVLFEMLEDAAVSGVPEGTALQAAREAKELFAQVEALQMSELDEFFGPGDVGSVPEEEEVIDEQPEEVRATETTIVTPQLVIDTLLEAISLDMSLHSNLNGDLASQHQLLETAKATFERAVALRQRYLPDCPPELEVEMVLAQFSIYSSPSSPDAKQILEQALAASPTPSPSLLSIYADHLVESLPFSQPFDVVAAQLESALSTYQKVQALLQNRLSPPKDVPSYRIPLLLSANLLAQATVHLLSYHMIAASGQAVELATPRLATAHSLALESISCVKSGLALTPSSTSSGLALVKSPPSHEPISNLSTLLALRSSYFTLVRIRLRMADSQEQLDEEKKRFWSVWNAVTRNLRAEPDLKQIDLTWWLGEIEEDQVVECIGADAAEKERQWWMSLAA
ncbi:uncharacterized protein JCM15063_003057 [Sporobolomyces koalae]|uniref:uncharacterized protein n=1 Tax=Sporobolomyces koalae TaxID=500713 RepID=UPI00316E3B2A